MVELPKDATGVTIPFDIDLLYDRMGNKSEVKSIEYRKQCSNWLVVNSNGDALYSQFLYIKNPLLNDSWDKLENDLESASASSSLLQAPCAWFCGGEGRCDDCKMKHNIISCDVLLFEEILNRIRNLRGETHDC